jgi:adenylylsulfate kinase
MSNRPTVIVVTGPVGSGKTTVAQAFRDVLLERGEPGAIIDVDALRDSWPHPPRDPFNEELGRDNLAAIWPNLTARGIRWLIIADVVEEQDGRRHYQQAFPGAEIVIARLDAPLELIIERLVGRETDDTIAWYRNRAPELQKIMTDANIGDFVIHVTDESPRALAEIILRRVESENQ